MANRSFKTDGFFPGARSRFSEAASPVTENRFWPHKRKIAIGLIAAWSFISYFEPIGLDMPTPLATGQNISQKFDSIREDKPSSSDLSSSTTTLATTEATASTATRELDIAQPSQPTLPPVNVEAPVTIPTVPVAEAPSTSADPESALPNPIASVVFQSGNIACTRTVQATFSLQIQADGTERVDYPLEAMSLAANQRFDQIIPSQAEKLWADTQSGLNGGAIERKSGVSFTSPADCSGFELIN